MWCFFLSVDFSSAGTLDQEIQIVGPSGIDVVYDSRELGYLWKDYIYEPEEPGKYQIYIRYGGFQIPGQFIVILLTTFFPKLASVHIVFVEAICQYL